MDTINVSITKPRRSKRSKTGTRKARVDIYLDGLTLIRLNQRLAQEGLTFSAWVNQLIEEDSQSAT